MDEKRNSEPVSSESQSNPHHNWPKTVTIIGVAAIMVLGIYFTARVFVTVPIDTVATIIQTFEDKTITKRLYEHIESVETFNRLQFTVLETTLTVNETDSQRILWEWLPLPDVSIRMVAPVEIAYYLDLNEAWKFRLDTKNRTVSIITPRIKYNTPSIDFDKLEIVEEKSSVIRNEEIVIDRIRKELMKHAKKLADEKIELIREGARAKVREFIHNWFVQHRFKDHQENPYHISILFSDEQNVELHTESNERVKIIQ